MDDNIRLKNQIRQEFNDTLFSDAEILPVTRAVNFISNAKTGSGPIPYNVLIETEDETIGNDYLFHTLKAIKRCYPSMRAGITRYEKLIRMILAGGSIYNDYDIIGIQNFSGVNDTDIAILSSWLESTPQIIRFFCISKNVSEKLLRKNEHFYYRILPGNNHIFVGRTKAEHIYDALLRKLRSDDYVCTDGFSDGICAYINTVYPKADLRGKEFLDDLYCRIIRALWDSEAGTAKEIGAGCVPGYKAAETSNSDLFIDTSLLENHTISNELKQRALPDGNCCQHILLMSLSTFGKQSRKWRYHRKDEKAEYDYYYQLEPVPQIIQRELGSKRIDKIILLCTAQVSDASTGRLIQIGTDAPAVMSELEYFKRRFCEWYNIPCGEAKDLFIKVAIDEQSPAAGVSEAARLIRAIKDSAPDKKTTLYIDEHGGLRGVQYISEAIISLMKNEIDVSAIYTAVPNHDNASAEIVTNDATIDMYDFVSGINEFINYGKIDSLEKYYREDQAMLNERLVGIRDIAEGLQLCDTKAFEKGLDEVRSWIKKEYSESVPEGRQIYLDLFRESIKDDYGELLREDGYDVLSLIEWCTRKGFIQQALTYVEDRMPRQFYVNRFINFSWRGLKGNSSDDEFRKDVEIRKATGASWYLDTGAILFYFLLKNVTNEYKKKFYAQIIKDNLAITGNPSKAWLKDEDTIKFLNSGINAFAFRNMGYTAEDFLAYEYEMKLSYERSGMQPARIHSMVTENANGKAIIPYSEIFISREINAKLNGMIINNNIEKLRQLKVSDYITKGRNENEYSFVRAFLTCIKILATGNDQLTDTDRTSDDFAKINYAILQFLCARSGWDEVLDAIAYSAADKLIPIMKKDDEKTSEIKLFGYILSKESLPDIDKETETETIRRRLLDSLPVPESADDVAAILSYNADDVNSLYEETFSLPYDDIDEIRKGYIKYRKQEESVERFGAFKPTCISDEVFDYYRKIMDFNPGHMREECSCDTWASIGDDCRLSVNNAYEISVKIPESVDRKLLEDALSLHAALKRERNNCNHASDKGRRVPVSYVRALLFSYVDICRKLQKQI